MTFHFAIRRVPVIEKIFFIQNLSLMLKTGFSLADALAALQEQSKNKVLRDTIIQLNQDVIKGESFSGALSKYPMIFDDLFVKMVAAGEVSGNLETTLQQLTVQLRKAYAMRKKVIQALIYPCIIIFAMLGAGIFMFIYVIPKILALYTDSSALPLPTRIILGMSSFVQNHYIIIAVGVVGALISFVVLWRNTTGRFWIDTLLLRIPIIGPIIKKINIAKISRLLNSLIVTDISIVRSFQIITQTLGNAAFRNFLKKATEHLSKGNTIYSLLKQRPDLFDPVIAHMISVGETSGSLDQMTHDIALFYEEDVDSTMSNLTTIIEPVLMLVIGVGVGFLAVAVIMPIYGIVDQV